MARPTRLLRLGSRSIESTAVVLQLHPSHEARVRQKGFQHHDSHNLPFLRECITLLPPVRPLSAASLGIRLHGAFGGLCRGVPLEKPLFIERVADA